MREHVGAVDQRGAGFRDILRPVQIDESAALAEAGVDNDVHRIRLVRRGNVDHLGALLGEHPRDVTGPASTCAMSTTRMPDERPRRRRERHRIAIADALDLNRQATLRDAAPADSHAIRRSCARWCPSACARQAHPRVRPRSSAPRCARSQRCRARNRGKQAAC